MEYDFELPDSITDDELNHRVPRHANSVLLQVVHDGPCKIYSTTDYENMTDVCLFESSSSGTNVIEIPL